MTQKRSTIALFFEGQLLHFFSVFVLLVALYFFAQTPGFHEGSFLGISTSTWMIFATANAILHQIYVWLGWRLELGGQHLTRVFGDKAFLIFKIGFAVLIALRPVLIFALGWSNRGTLMIEPWLGYAIAFVLFIPGAYLAYSVMHYFGLDRAFGIDHFDPSYRNKEFVRKGIFNWTPNAMYVFGFLNLWIPAFLFQSTSALALAAFSHIYIWVHYFCTEKPDMRRIYG